MIILKTKISIMVPTMVVIEISSMVVVKHSSVTGAQVNLNKIIMQMAIVGMPMSAAV